MFDSLKLSQALNSRLCHEVAGLIGSISTTAELIKISDKAIGDEAKDILNVTARQLANILRFYRLAYGLCSETSLTDLSEIKNLCEGIINDKVTVHFKSDEHYSLDSNLAKVILCLVIISLKSIIKTGIISLSFLSATANSGFKIQVSSHRLKKDSNKTAILLGEIDHIFVDVSNSHEFYTYFLVKKLGMKINIVQSDVSVTYSIS